MGEGLNFLPYSKRVLFAFALRTQGQGVLEFSLSCNLISFVDFECFLPSCMDSRKLLCRSASKRFPAHLAIRSSLKGSKQLLHFDRSAPTCLYIQAFCPVGR